MLKVSATTGDFNEPSHLSWDGAGDGKLKVDWPCSKAAEGAGLLDCYWWYKRQTGEEPIDSWTWDWEQYLGQSEEERETYEGAKRLGVSLALGVGVIKRRFRSKRAQR